MKSFLFCVVLLAIVAMAVLNPMGRSAFVGYYAGVIATVVGLRFAGQASAAWDSITHRFSS
jgi:hypothetical protein